NGMPIERTTAVIAAGKDLIHGNAGADIIFGDHGVIDQVAGTLRLVNAGNVTRMTSAEFTNGDVDSIFGDAGDDRIFGGGAGDTIAGGADNNIVFGDEGTIDLVIRDGSIADIDL